MHCYQACELVWCDCNSRTVGNIVHQHSWQTPRTHRLSALATSLEPTTLALRVLALGKSWL